MQDEPDSRSRLMATLDGVETVTIGVYVALLTVVAVAILAVVAYIVMNPPTSWGTQGEWFYVGIIILMAFLWVMAQLFTMIRRLQRRRSTSGVQLDFDGDSPVFRIKDDGVSLEWKPTGAAPPPGAKTFSFGFQIPTTTPKTIILDRARLDEARTARRFGKNWEEIARQVNPDYEQLSDFERSLYQRALQLAVDAPETP